MVKGNSTSWTWKIIVLYNYAAIILKECLFIKECGLIEMAKELHLVNHLGFDYTLWRVQKCRLAPPPLEQCKCFKVNVFNILLTINILYQLSGVWEYFLHWHLHLRELQYIDGDTILYNMIFVLFVSV